MDTTERIEKLDRCCGGLRCVALILAEANDTRFPSARITSAISNINKAVAEVGREIVTLLKQQEI